MAVMVFESVTPGTTSAIASKPSGSSELVVQTASTNSSLQDSRVSIDLDYLPRGSTIGIKGAFIGMSGALVELASCNSRGKLKPFRAHDIVHRIDFGFDYDNWRQGYPIVTNAQACVAVWEIANTLVNNRKFAEFTGDLQLNGRYGAGFKMFSFDTPTNTALMQGDVPELGEQTTNSTQTS